ncbi:GH23319 [Drosophila grimshawi]|uniref:GH23319 n=1 Tax=Drosophila grimshawi TaxID=7222 RepID=B4K001_DROGR|nr:GH23319 [Drosophila grimshawi]
MNRKSRSSLKKVSTQAEEETNPAISIKRRISFSGKKFIREFVATEKARDYDHSYEISDNTNGSDSSDQAHGTVAASVLQSTAHISLTIDEMDKENAPLAIAAGDASGSLHDQYSMNDCTLKFQTSINVTLLPDELKGNRNRTESSTALMELTSSDSLSLYEVERDKLRENSMYNKRVLEKTIDLLPPKMVFSELMPKQMELENVQKTTVMSMDVSCVTTKEKELEQKTVMFESHDITCDFEDIDDSTLSSPLIPLDVISENGISKKLNYRELNDALNSGRLKVYANGPRTPATDRTAKQRSFWHDPEQQPMDEDVPQIETIKRRGTLNFNDSMIVSPVPQKTESKPMAKTDQSVKRNYRFSQADELMLDNTNFLVHAKMGDETQSQSTSKCSSRREMTCDNTAMELDDLDKHEAAVAAALASVKYRKSLHCLEGMEGDDFLSPPKDAIDTQTDQKCSRNNIIGEDANKALQDEQRSRPRQTLHMVEPIEEISSPAAPREPQYNKQRTTMHMAEPITVDIVKPQIESKDQQQAISAPKLNSKARRETLHLAEAMDEDIEEPRQEYQLKQVTASVEYSCSRRRQTLHSVESMDESLCADNNLPTAAAVAALIKPNRNQYRQTMHLAEVIQEENIIGPQHELKPLQQYSRRRQTLVLADPIEDDISCAQKDSMPAGVPIESHPNKRRQTMHMAETIEEDDIIPPQQLMSISETSGRGPQKTKRRQTLRIAECIEEDIVKQHTELKSQTVAPRKRRQTLHLAESIEEDTFCAQKEVGSMSKAVSPNFQIYESVDEDALKPQQELKSKSAVPKLEQQYNRRRQTLHLADPIEEDAFCAQKEVSSMSKTANQKFQMDESVDEEVLKPQQKLQSKSAVPSLEQQYNKRRQKLHLADPIEEDAFCAQKEVSSVSAAVCPNFQMDESVDEEVLKPQQKLQSKSAVPSLEQQYNRRRQTLHMADPIEEDSLCEQNNLRAPVAPIKSRMQLQSQTAVQSVEKQSNRQRQAVLISEDIICRNEDSNLRAKHQLKSRQTLHKAESMEVVICDAAKSLRLEGASADQLDPVQMEESMEEYISCVPRHTVHKVEPMVEEMPTARRTEQRSSRPRVTQLLSESMGIQLLSQSSGEDVEKACAESPSDSTEWLAQMRNKARQTLTEDKSASPIEGKANALKLKHSKSIMETPKMNKEQQLLRHNYFPITPGRSMIEYEDLEEECKSDSRTPTPPAAAAARSTYQAVDKDLDMDTSNYDTPIRAADKKTTSFNIKRLPTHLTPNLPQSKKRNTQSIQLEDRNNINQNSPWCEPEQLDGTVQMVRAQMTQQTRSHFETGITNLLADGKHAICYDDNPIIISDVSNHFMAQRELAKRSVEQPNDASGDSRNSNELNFKSYATAHREFINLSGDTVIFAAAELPDDGEANDCEIEKTQLSLVSTLLDEENDDEDRADQSNSIELESDGEVEAEPEACLEQLNPPAVAGAVDACKKCKHCRRSVDLGRNSLGDSFELPDWRELNVEFERLERLRKRKRLSDVHRYWELKKLERYSHSGDETANHINETSNAISDTTNRLNLPQMLEMFNTKWQEYKKIICKPNRVETFVKRLEASMRAQLPNWIFDYKLQNQHKYIFSHRKITTFRIVVSYKPLDSLETEICVDSIQLDTVTLVPKALWSTYEHLMDFQLRLKLPLNLDNLLDGNDVEAFVLFLQHIDSICMEIRGICNSMHTVLIAAQARLIREPNRTVVRKTVRRLIKEEDEAYMRVEKAHFCIEIGNVREMSFKDILEPPIYHFDENIQFLPKGIAFLEAFIHNPEQYLKRNVDN